MEIRNYQADGTVPKSKRKIREKEIKSIPSYTHIHDCSLSWLGTDPSIKSGGVKLVLRTHFSTPSEINSFSLNTGL